MQETNTTNATFKDRVNGNIKPTRKEYLYTTIMSCLAFAAGWFGVRLLFFLALGQPLFDSWHLPVVYAVTLCVFMPWFYCMSVRSVKFVEIEDCGGHLSVCGGPGSCLFRATQMAEKIEYANIESFGKPNWDTNKGYYYGVRLIPKENLKVFSIFPGDSTRKGDEIAIVLKEPVTLPSCCGWSWTYRTVLLCVNDYQQIEALLERKCAANSAENEGDQQVTVDLAVNDQQN